MNTVRMKWSGIRPLIMSNPRTVNVADPYAIEARRINALLKIARKKNDGDKLLELEEQQRRNDFKSSSYFDKEGFFIPDTIILAVLKAAAQTLRKGKDIDRAVLMSETEARVKTLKQFKSLDDAFADPSFHLEGPCRVPPKTGALIWKCRAMIPTGWEIVFSLEYEESLIARKTLIEIAEVAGRLVGVGSWRPKFGRFDTEVLS